MEVHRQFKDQLVSGSLTLIDVSCPVCGSRESQPIATIDRQGLPVRTVLCGNCPTMYSQEVLTDDGLNYFYQSVYRKLYGGMPEPTESWFRDQAASGSRILSEMIAHDAGWGSCSGKRVLDIGCGAGGVLVAFKEAGATETGIDQNESFLEFGRSRGLNLISGQIFDLPGLPRQDLIILKDVLEHLPRPLDALRSVVNQLSPDGYCHIQVPSFESLKFLGYRDDLLRYLQFAHVTHFTEQSLVFLCVRAGLKVVYSDKRAVVLCQIADRNVVGTVCPPNDSAVHALDLIYRRRLISAWEHSVRSRIPTSLKPRLRALRDRLKRRHLSI
jgi:2-polyprenyl-3-methyl-5-hydroxy-6-metoxy-1,4-benzoquinol methylase